MNKNIALVLVLVFYYSSSLAFGVSKTDQPNVIVIMTDDQGYPELSIHGKPILKTLNNA